MHTIDFKKEGGFPLEQNTLDFMQEAQHAIMQALVALCGCEASKKYIIYGCHLSNNQISAGWMIVNNEILYFAGGTGTAIAPTTDITNVVFENGETHGVYEYKKAIISSSGTPISQFIRLTNIKDLLSGVPNATTTAKGVIEIATTSEVASGSSSNLAVTPKGLKDAGYPRDPNYKHTDNNYTTAEKNKLESISNASESKAGLAEKASVSEADTGTDNIRFMTPYLTKREIDRNKVTVPNATTAQKGIVELATSSEATAGTDGKVITANLLRTAVISIVKSMLKHTYGTLTISNRRSINNSTLQNNWSYNYAYVYPPSGYTMSHLVSFNCSIAEINFAGDVNGDDDMFCKWRKESNRIKIICNNSENEAAAKVNYAATWMK